MSTPNGIGVNFEGRAGREMGNGNVSFCSFLFKIFTKTIMIFVTDD